MPLIAIEQSDVSAKPNGLVWAAVARFVTVALFFDALAPLFPQIAASHSLSANLFQILLGVCYIAFAISQLASVPIIGIVGLYRSSALSCIFLGLAAVLLCVTQNAYLFAALFISMFAVNSIGSNATRVALRETTSDEGYKRLFAWASSAVEIKQITMPLIAGSLVAAFGWRWALAALVAPVVIAGIWIGLMDRGQQEKLGHTAPSVAGFSRWKMIATMPAFLSPTLIAASFQIAFSPLSARLPFILSDEANLTPTMVGLVLSAASGVVAFSFVLSGYLVSRRSGASLVKAGVAILAVGLAVMISSYLLGIYYAIVGIILVQGAFGFIIVPCSGDALSAADTQRTMASALFGFVQPVVGGLSTAITGALGTPHIGGSVGLTVTALCLIIATTIAIPPRSLAR